MFDFDFSKEMKRAETEGAKSAQLALARRDKDFLVRKYGTGTYENIEQSIQNGIQYTDIVSQLAAEERRKQELQNPPPIKGSAKFANWHELKQQNLLFDPDDRTSTSEIFLGAFFNADPELRKRSDNWLYWNGQSHLMTIAPTGAGKSTLLLIPNLLQYTGSVFVFDPKGELYRATSFYRSQIGKVFRLAPFENGTDAFNPLDQIQSFDDALEFAEIIFPRESDGDGAFYENEARSFLAALIYLVSIVGKGPERTMSKIRRLLSLSTHPETGEDGKPAASKFDTFLHSMANVQSLPTPIKRAASLVAQYNPQARTTLLRSLNEKLQIWDSEAMERVTRESSFRFEDMKKETVTVYLTVPFNRIEAYSYYVRAMMTFALEAMVADETRPKKPVLFILDEFLRLGKFQRFVHALRTHRDAGVRLWFILQSIADMEESYPENWKSFFTATEVKSFFGIRDHYTAKTISEMLGNYTLAHETVSSSSGQSLSVGTEQSTSTSQGSSNQIHYEERPLLDPNEVQAALGTAEPDGTRKGILSIGGLNPMGTIMLPWYKGYRNHCRFGSRDNPITPSPLLEHLWERFNADLFNGELSPLTGIGYQDYSMGRDGYMPHDPAFRGFYDGEFHRIILIKAIQEIEDILLKAKSDSWDNLNQIMDAVFAYISPLLIHEMAHQLTEQRGGVMANHNAQFVEACEFIYRNNLEKELGFPWPKPSANSISTWPPNPKLDETLTYIRQQCL